MSVYAVRNPASGELVAEYPTIEDDALVASIENADGAYALWRTVPVAERSALLRRVADLYDERAADLGAIVTREMGKPIKSAQGEAAVAASIYRYYADSAESLAADEPVELLGGSGSAVIRRSPLGVLLGIMPWNYPYYQVARFAGPNLLMGNTVLLKPAPQCPESAAAMAEIFRDAGLPVNVFQNVLATNEQIAMAIEDRRVRGVSLTGSEAAGSAVAELAGRHLKKVVLELGGSDPFVVLSTDDIDGLVSKAVAARMGNTGQACNAAKRFIVADAIYDEFVELFVAKMADRRPGDPTDPRTSTGPLSSVAAAERLEDQVRRAVDEGAKVLYGGGRDGAFFEPTVIGEIRPESEAYATEFFGPVAQIYRAANEADAIEIANGTEYGLGSYVFSTDPDQAIRVADRIEAGMVFVNTTDGEGPEVPFGGIKRSGFGRELGRLGADEFVNKKLIRLG